MELYLLRHGAAEAGCASGRDQDRALTAAGEQAVQELLTRVQGEGVAPRWIVASPYLRAQQTARIAARVFGYEEPVLLSTRLTPESAPVDLWAEVRDMDPDSPLLFIGHEPLLSAAASWLIGETSVTLNFRPGTLVRIDFDEIRMTPQGRHRWTLHAQ
jgi:phosphohistidine phosphatase